MTRFTADDARRIQADNSMIEEGDPEYVEPVLDVRMAVAIRRALADIEWASDGKADLYEAREEYHELCEACDLAVWRRTRAVIRMAVESALANDIPYDYPPSGSIPRQGTFRMTARERRMFERVWDCIDSETTRASHWLDETCAEYPDDEAMVAKVSEYDRWMAESRDAE